MEVRPPVPYPVTQTYFWAPRIAGSRSMWGMVDDAPYWRAVMKLYDDDNLSGATALIEKLGMGLGLGGSAASIKNLIDSEYLVRRDGVKKELGHHLTLEYLANEQESRIDSVGQLIVETVAALKERFSWTGEEEVLVTLLASDEDAPWATARFGYCAQKTNHYKICIPFHATHEPYSFYRVFSHEFVHVMSLSQTHKRINQWVGEGFSVYASNDCDNRARSAFQSNPRLWLTPERLELQFRPGLDLGTQEKWFAYQQAGWIISFLAKKHGEKNLMGFLAEYADESILRNLKLLALGESRTRDAIHAAYHTTPKKLFDDVAAALGSI